MGGYNMKAVRYADNSVILAMNDKVLQYMQIN